MPNENDLKDGDQNSAANGQGGNKDGGDNNGAGNGEETVTIKKSEWEKNQSDLNNYRTAVVNLKKGKPEGGTGDQGDGQGGKKDDQSQQIDVTEKDPEVRIKKSNENRAQRAFEIKRPEFKDPATKAAILSHLRENQNSITVEDFGDDLEDAFFTYLRKEGKLDEYVNSDKETARRKAEAQVNMGMNAGNNGDGKGKGQSENAITDRGRELAGHLHVPEEKLEAIDPKDPGHNKILKP